MQQNRYIVIGGAVAMGTHSRMPCAGIYPVPVTPRDNMFMQDAITRDPEMMHGKPVFRGTRIPVQTLFDYLEAGDSLEDFLEGFPTVGRQLVIQVLEECKNLRLARV